MDDSRLVSIAQITEFLKIGGISFVGKSRDETYRWIEMILGRFWYFSLRKKEKTMVKKYIMKMTGYSDAQLTMLIRKKKQTRVIREIKGKRHTFEKKYTPADVALLIKTDAAHGRLSGPATKNILERFLAPLLAQLIEQFPFRVINFHSDNGSEYINQIVAHLLNKMMIDQTKSRPRHSNDNGLVETKNGSIIRKHFGYAYISQCHAEKINEFYRTFLTPFEKLQSLERPEQYLKPTMTMYLLKQFASQMSDTEAAEGMQTAKRELFKAMRAS